MTESVMYPVPFHVTAQQVTDAFTGAFEGGSNHWLHSANMDPTDPPENWGKKPGLVFWGQVAFFNRTNWRMALTFDNPNKGAGAGCKIITGLEVISGLSTMAAKYPRHFGDFISGNSDAETDDVFCQCVVLGDVIYG